MAINETTQHEGEWFATWFDSPYYPMLYRHRNEEEALQALQNLHQLLKLPTQSWVLDLGCGQGRHSRTLHGLGYSVVGIDLSPASIAYAREHASEGQIFEVHDMRTFTINRQFSAVFNLFTSFGYFDSNAENKKVLERINAHLLPGGLLVLDYLNAFPLLHQNEQRQMIVVDGVEFNTMKTREGNSIIKHIEVLDHGVLHHFKESVQLLTRDDLVDLISSCGFEIENILGNYDLAPFDPDKSPRCLIIARKS
jgi:SAM-dependent methyltransferase